MLSQNQNHRHTLFTHIITPKKTQPNDNQKIDKKNKLRSTEKGQKRFCNTTVTSRLNSTATNISESIATSFHNFLERQILQQATPSDIPTSHATPRL